MSFADNLKRELLFNDIQIKEFAGKVNVPYSTLLSYVSKDKRLPKVDIAVKIAQEKAVNGDTILLSPACASFDEFNNFEERGDAFKKLINLNN